MERPFRGWALGLIVLFVCLATGSAQAVKIRVVADKGNIRLLPDPRSAVVKVVPKGAVLAADDIENEWFRVFLPGGEAEYDLIGFIHQGEAEKVDAGTLIPNDGASVPEERKRPFSVKIFGGTAYCQVGFPNTVRDYFDRYFRSEAAASTNLVILQGGIAPLNNGYNAGAEFIVEFGRLSFGLGTEYIRVEKTGTMNFATKHWDPALYVFSMTDRLTVIPIRVNAYATILKSRIGRVRLFGGGGMYFGHFSDVWTGVNEKGDSLYFRQKADASDLGFQAGVEIELNLNKNFALVAEGLGRLVKINGFTGSAEGSENWFHQKAGISETSRGGTLYAYEFQMTPDGPWTPNLLIFETTPTNDSLGLNYRQSLRNVTEASLDFSGYSARVGLRINF